MGYYTLYQLKMIRSSSEDKKGEFAEMVKEMNEKYVLGIGMVSDTETDIFEAKWYHWEKDMTDMSKKYPDILFELSGDGEEQDDFWKARFLNGECEYSEAKMVYEPFSKLA